MPESSGSIGTGTPILDLAIVLALILVGGFFAASEIALITVKRHRLNQLVADGSRAARVAQRLTEDPSRFLATIQIAITFLGFLASAVGAVAFSGALADVLRLIPLAPLRDAAGEISFVLVALLIALASIIIGELVPKTLALAFPDRFALFVARPIGWFDRLLRPIVWLVATLSNILVRALGGRDRPQAGYLSTEELKMLVETGSEQGGIEEDEKEMIHGVIELAETEVHDFAGVVGKHETRRGLGRLEDLLLDHAQACDLGMMYRRRMRAVVGVCRSVRLCEGPRYRQIRRERAGEQENWNPQPGGHPGPYRHRNARPAAIPSATTAAPRRATARNLPRALPISSSDGRLTGGRTIRSTAAGPVNPDWIICWLTGISVQVETIMRVPAIAVTTTLCQLFP